MMMLIRQTLEALLNPYFIGLLLVLIVLMALFRGARSRFWPGLLLGVFLLFLIISTGFLPAFLTHQLESRYPPLKKPDPNVHWIVVFSGGQANAQALSPFNRLYNSSIKRLIAGIYLGKGVKDARILLSGGAFGDEPAEAETMLDYAKMLGLETANIQLETASLNTADQAKAIKKIVHTEPFYLVTSAIHMPRAMALCKQQGLEPIAAPTDFTLFWQDERWQKTWIPNAYNMVYFNIAFHEMLGLLWMHLKTGQ